VGKLDVMGVAEIALRLGVTKSRASQIVARKGFPEPAARLIGQDIWETKDVEAWISVNRPPKPEGES
jgi:prophage regulatory protein